MLDEYQDLIEELLGTPGIVRGAGDLEAEKLRLLAALHERDAVVLDRVQRLVRETSPHLKALAPFDEAIESLRRLSRGRASSKDFEAGLGFQAGE